MFKFNHYFKIVCSVIFLLSLLVISSCGGDQKKVSELDVEPNCKGVVCILRVVDKHFLRTRNILGQTQYTLLKTTPLKSNDPKDDGTHLLWSSKDGTLATQEELTNAGLGTCPDGKCTVTSNPTGFEADHLGISTGHVKGYVTNPDGKKEYIDKDVSVNITATKPTVTATASQDNPLSYAVKADLTNTGITAAWSYQWSSTPEGTFKDATVASTEVEFGKGGVYTISFTATPPEGSTDVAQTGTTTVTTGQSGASINYKQEKGLLYSFTANTTNTGLPKDGVTYAWSVNDNPIGTGSSVTYLFTKANTQYTVSLETKIADKVIGTNSVTVKTGNLINPTLTVTQDGANPLAYTVTADESATNIGSDWSRVWSIDGEAVEGASTAKLSYTFGLTDHKYTVSYVASKEGYPDRTASIDVTTKGATKPTVTATVSQDNPLSYAVNADLTNTGITDAWNYQWSSTPEATFKDATLASTEVEFANGGVGYTITFTATPPEGSTDVAQTGTTTVTTGQSGASINYKQEKGLLYSFTANTTNTGLPKDGVTYAWSVNDNPIGTGSSVTYLFTKANTQYTVSLETKIADKVIGTNSVTVKTGNLINPTLTVTQDGANPLAYTVTADESATNIGSDWSRVWSIDGEAVEGASTAKLSYTFGLTDHKYTVSYVASKEGYPDRTASIDVTTKGATKPTVTATVSQDNPLSYAVNADLTNTGITDAWNYQWSSTPEATFKDATLASTEVEFANGGVGYTITFTATPPEGSTDVAQTGTTTVTTGQSGASINYKQEKGLLYSFTANTTNTGLPKDGVTYAWSVNDNPIGTGSSVTYLFTKANTQYTVSLETKIADKVIGTNSVTVKTGNLINPTLTVTQDGANPLAYTVTADESATNIGSDWSRVWSIDGEAVEGASTAKLSYTFGLTDHKYTVSYVASKEGYPDRTASIDVTTKGATKPTVTATVSQDNPLSYAVNADLTNTGITDAWNYQWSSTPEATFKDATLASTEVEFANGGVGYTITFTATPPEGSTDVAQTGTTTVTTGQSGASINYKQEKGLLYSFTANTTNTGLPKDGVTYAWSVNDNPIGTGSSVTYLFTKANTQYTVSLETKIADKVIGTNSVTVKTGNLINPTLTVTQDGANPLAYTVTADESATNIGSDWSRVWSIDGEAVEGASTAKLSYTFGLTDHKYTVSYVASKEGYPDRTASIDVTTKGATKPTVTATVSQDNPLSYAVNADLTNTGITDAWNYQWSSTPEATFKDATLASTEVEFANGGVGYTITFTATPPEGSTDVAQTGTTTVTTGQSGASINYKQEKGLLYSFTANTTNTGLPKDGVTYAWSVNDNPIGTGSSVTYLFTKANTQYTVSLETKIADKVIGTNSVTVKTGNLINPTLTVTQDGANPLAYTVTADESATNIGSDWSRVWSIDGEAVEGASTAKLSYTFGLTDHKYTVSYVASKEGYPDRTASIDVTTKGATKPTVTATVSQDNPLSYAVNADLTNTGITDAWNYQWSSTPEATFKDATLASTEVEFANGGVGYTITFTATPPEGSTDVAQTGTTTVTTGQSGASINYKQEKGLLYSFTANTTNTGLPKDGVTYAWSVNDNPIGTGSSVTYLFTKANTQYTVSLETKIADKVIGTNSVTVKTGNLINPTLTVTQDGANPLAYTVTADESATNIGSDWSRVWSIDGEAVEGASTAKLSYTFGLTDHKYTVSYVASKEGYPDRTASIDVTTKGATKPTVTATVSQDNPLSYAVNADLTNTGITDAWNYQWSSTPEATFKDATLASTEVEFANRGVAYTISFTATPPKGSSDKAQTGTTTVTIGQLLGASISVKQEKGLLYSFTANTTNTGLPKDGVTYAWSVNDNPIGTGSSVTYLFTKANTQYTVSLETKIADKVIGTNSVTVKTGNLINPTLTVTQDGANPLAYTVTADESATNIGSDWSRVWSIDGEAVEGASTAKLSYTFGLTAHKYTVSYVASKEGYPDRTASIDVTTKGATKPTITLTATSESSYYVAKADLTNTGITDAWSYGWRSTPRATFVDFWKATTDVYFPLLLEPPRIRIYDITFTATPPKGSSDKSQRVTRTFTIDNPTLTATQDGANPLAYTITADESAISIRPDSRVWSIDGKVVDGASSNRLHYTFGLTDHKYTVSYVASKEGYDDRTASIDVTTKGATKPTVTATASQDNPLSYAVKADLTNTGITAAWSYRWTSTPSATFADSTKATTSVDLPSYRTSYNLTFTATPPEGSSDKAQTATTTVTTGDVINPTLSAKQAGADPLAYTVTAATTGTNIGSGWTYKWSGGDGVTFTTATGTIASAGDSVSTGVDFALTAHKYTVVFTATSPQGAVRTSSIDVTTKAATKPTITLAASPDSSYYLVKADLTNTGITDAWSYVWMSTPTATFVYPLAATTGVYFSVPPGTRKSYDLTFTAVPPEGSSDKVQRVTRTVTIDDSHVINLTLTATQDGANPLAYTITADESATNIGADWSRVWSIDGKVVDGASTDRLHYTFGLTDHKYTVRYVASKEGYIGRTESIDVTTKAATKPTITLTATSDSSYYVAKADLTNTGITAAWNYGWKSTPTATFVHPLAATTGVYFSVPPGTRKSYDLTFTATPPEGSSDKSQRVTRTFTIADSHVINPTLTATQDGANPLAYTVTADESATNIGSDWSRVWSIDGKVVDGASTAKLSYTFGLTDHKYTVSYVASKEGYTDRTASIDVTTKAATKPTVTATASQDNPLSYAVKADLTNTGITDAWSYQWSSTPEGTFKDATVASTDVEFANGGVTYTISFTATPPEGSSDKSQRVTTTVTTDDVINPTLSAKQAGADPLAYTVTAATTGTNIGSGWTYKWSGGDGVTFTTATGTIASAGDSVSTGVDFALTAHKYTVVFTATSPQGVVRTNSVDVTTGAATAPKLSSSAGSSDLNFNVKADLTDTGITDAWSYGWTSTPSATFADSTKATTSVDLPSYGTSYNLTFTATPPEGSSDKAQTGTTKVTIGQLDLSISVKKVKGLLYDFTINTTNTLPKEASYIWRLNNPTNRPPTTSFTSTVQGRPYLFPRANMKFTVILEVELGDKVIGTDSVTVTTGDLINPTFTATQDGANPLVYTLTADESETNIKWIPATVTRKWFVDGNLVAQNTKTLHYTFGLTNHTYHIKYNATAPWNDTRKVKPDITTKAATKPTVTATASQDNPLSYVVKADLTNTGITDAWSYQWSSTPEGTFKDATAATTDVEFGKGGVHTISFTATPPEGSSDKAQTATTTVTAGQLGASIRVKQEKGLLYTFTPNTTNTGLPSEGVTYAWSINGNSIGSGSSITYLFPNANKRYTVSLETKIGTKVIGTDSVTVKVGGSIDPAIIATRDGVNPLVYTIMADESATNIGADWSRQWYIDGKVVAQNTKTLHYTFDLTFHTYTIKYVVSHAGYDSREVTEDVKTKAANVPTATATPSQDNPLSYTVSAHLTNTGITAAWRYHWRSIPSATFADPTKATTSVDFPSFGKSYELIFLATPPESTQFLKRAIIKVTLGKSISVKQEKGLLYSFTANTTNTGLPSEGVVYNWSVNNNPIGTGSNIDYFFAKANTQYTVSLETKIGDKVIGTDSVTVTTGDIVNPALSVTHDGVNPLVYTIMADESATNIGADWSRVWSIDGKVVDGASTDTLHYTFGLTHHLYTVKYVASHAGYDSREATKGVTTALANNPTLTATESQDNPLSYTVNADLTNTGITAAWSYQWSSTPSAKFADSTKATTSVDLPSYTTSYKLTFTAIPPNESTSRARRGTTTITPGHTVS